MRKMLSITTVKPLYSEQTRGIKKCPLLRKPLHIGNLREITKICPL